MMFDLYSEELIFKMPYYIDVLLNCQSSLASLLCILSFLSQINTCLLEVASVYASLLRSQ